jgi:hypothetical protein
VETNIEFTVPSLPPAKSEALSMLGPGHKHADRVVELLRHAKAASDTSGFHGFGTRPVGLELRIACPRDGNRSDATNYLGAITDVLEDKGHRGPLEHLGELASFGLYDNDRQIEEVHYYWQPAGRPSYTVRLWAIRVSDD